MDADAKHSAVAQRGIMNVKDDPVPRLAEQPVDARSAPQHVVQQPQSAKDRHACGLDHQARTDRARRIETLEKGDLMARPMQQQRRRQSTRPAACDRDVQTPHDQRLDEQAGRSKRMAGNLYWGARERARNIRRN